MKTILIASLLAFVNDPTGAPTCEEELLVCQDEQEVANDAIEALVYSIDDLVNGGGNPTGGGVQPCTSTVCQIVDACRAQRTDNLGKCVEEGCAATPDNCL